MTNINGKPVDLRPALTYQSLSPTYTKTEPLRELEPIKYLLGLLGFAILTPLLTKAAPADPRYTREGT
jgi:hypothetical protein